ncbi:MAG: hypothetical protein ACOX2F_00560 [bacterium]
MRKIYFLALIAVSMILGACVEQHNLVVLDKFVPISAKDQCEIKVGGDRYYTKGTIDLALTGEYKLAFQITNYISSSEASEMGSTEAPIGSAETNRFFAKWVEIKYEWDPRPQPDGRRLSLTGDLWNKVKRIEVHGVVADPEGGQNAGYVDIFTEVQAKDLLEHVNDIDWIASPLLIKMKVVGEITDGSKITTNTLHFNVMPTFGKSIQMGSVYPEPAGGFADDKEWYDTVMYHCAFEAPIVDGCLVGQDSAMSNCYAGDTPWQKYIATSRCHLDPSVDDCYRTGYGAASVVEVFFNRYQKSTTDDKYYHCCPGEAPDAPEEEEDGAEN